MHAPSRCPSSHGSARGRGTWHTALLRAAVWGCATRAEVTETDGGSLGTAVISFWEQITFPAAKDMLGLNKNGNSRQIDLGAGRVLLASHRCCPGVGAGDDRQQCGTALDFGVIQHGPGVCTALLQSSHSSHPAGPGCCALPRCAPERPQGSELFVCSFLGEKSHLGKKKKKKINHTPENKICLLKCTSGINGVLQIRQFTAWVSNEKTHPGVKAQWESDLDSGLPPCTPEPASLPLHLYCCSLRTPCWLSSASWGGSFPGASSRDLR